MEIEDTISLCIPSILLCHNPLPNHRLPTLRNLNKKMIAIGQYVCNHFKNVSVKTYSIFGVIPSCSFYTEDGISFHRYVCKMIASILANGYHLFIKIA